MRDSGYFSVDNRHRVENPCIEDVHYLSPTAFKKSKVFSYGTSNTFRNMEEVFLQNKFRRIFSNPLGDD